MGLLIFYLCLALGVSFLCSILEAVLLSITPSHIAVCEQKQVRYAPALRGLKEDIDRPLAAILSLNTIAHTVGAAGVGAEATRVFGEAYLGLTSAVLTLLILFLSEIIPKTLGAVFWRRLTPLAVPTLLMTIWLMWPLVKISKAITRLLSRGEAGATVTPEQIAALAERGHKEGVFEAQESRILRNLFRLRSLRVGDIMTPRTVAFLLPESMTVGEALKRHEQLRFTRIPVHGPEREQVNGYVMKFDIMLRAAQRENETPLAELRREILIVPEKLALTELFERMVERQEHIAIAIDEYGGMAGLVTLEDVVETLLGQEIVDEADSVADMRQLARSQWLRRAKKLGLVGEDASMDEATRQAVIRHGLTGGRLPPGEAERQKKDEEGE